MSPQPKHPVLVSVAVLLLAGAGAAASSVLTAASASPPCHAKAKKHRCELTTSSTGTTTGTTDTTTSTDTTTTTATTTTTTTENTLVSASTDELRWAAPPLQDPQTVVVPDTGPASIVMDKARDYIVDINNRKGLVILNGGRNVVVIGGHIEIPWQGDGASVASRTGLRIYNWTGTMHIEGLLINGADLTEGINIQTTSLGTVLQLQNVRVENVHARNHNWSDNHPDIIQVWSGPEEVRIDRFTGESDYQGLFWAYDPGVAGSYPPKRVIQSRTNLRPSPVIEGHGTGACKCLPTSHVLWWPMYRSTTHIVSDSWMVTGYRGDERRRLSTSWGGFINSDGSFTNSSWLMTGTDGQTATSEPTSDLGRRQVDRIEWPGTAQLEQAVWHWGAPPEGDFAASAGAAYASPGYSSG